MNSSLKLQLSVSKRFYFAGKQKGQPEWTASPFWLAKRVKRMQS